MILYEIVCRHNNKRYIGITSRRNRFETHCYNARVGYAGALYNAIRKHGPRSFTYQVLREGLSVPEAKQLEREYIVRLNTHPPYGYNLTEGGDGSVGCTHSLASRRRRSARQRKRMRSALLRKRVSAAMKLLTKTPEHLANIAAALSGKILTTAVRAKISKTLTGKRQSPQTCQKRSETLKRIGHQPPPHALEASRRYWKGRPKSVKQRAKISRALKGRPAPKKTRSILLEWARKPNLRRTDWL